MPQRPIITLTTDFGLTDPYVASVKGVILSLNPEAIIVDISHAVRPQRVRQGAFLLETVHPYFPPGTIHLAVVDPGVGTERRAIALRTARGSFIGPDNGLLSAALPDDIRSRVGRTGGRVRLPEGGVGVALTNPRYHRQPVSDTFHGRDIFAPAVAHLSMNVPLPDLGEAIDEIFALPPVRAEKRPDGSLRGKVIHIDIFGNLITDVRRQDLLSPRATVEIGGRQIGGVGQTYAGNQGLSALVGSSGYLEIALAGGSAAAELGADIDEPVVVRN